jgi:hypothetical protein
MYPNEGEKLKTKYITQDKTNLTLLVLVLGILSLISVGIMALSVLRQLYPQALSAINKQLNYQGKLQDASGITVPDGTYNMKFSIYDASSGGNRLWTECGTTGTPTARSVSVYSGVFSVMLGDTASGACPGGTNSNEITLNFNIANYWFGLTVGSDLEMTPRKRIGAAGYAFNADLLDGLNTSNSGGTTAFVPVTDASGHLTLTQNLTLGGVLRNSDGTAAAPSYSFTADPDTGFYRQGVDSIGISLGGALRGVATTSDFRYDTILSATPVTLTLRGQVADGASAVGATIGSSNVLSVAGSKIASFVNAATERAYISKDGHLQTGGTIYAVTGLNFSSDFGTSSYGFLQVSGGGFLEFRSAATNYPIKVLGNPSNTGTAIGTHIGAVSNLTAAGAKLVSFVNNNAAEKAYIDKDGNFYGPGANFSGLTASSAVYTDASKNLTSTAPTSGAIGYWSRSSTTLSPATANDVVSITGSLGNILTLTSSATDVSNKVINISQTGATSGVDYGAYISNTGAATTNIGLYATASGATSNYAAIFDAGNVGIGTTGPASKLDVTTTALGASQTNTSGLALVNTTAAALGAQQISPAIRWRGFGWKTDATAASQPVDFRSYVVPVQGAASPTGYLAFESAVNDGPYSATPPLVITTGGNIGIGTTTPSSLLSVGGTAGSQFLVNSSGAIAAATGITSSGEITFSGLTVDRPVITTAGGKLTTEAQLAIARGGTAGTATPVAGAVAYGTGSAYAFSTAGTAGQALISGGAAAPSWFAPTAGSVIFAGTGGVLSQDNANLFWDNTNKRLGIGGATPGARLDVKGTIANVGGLTVSSLSTPGAPTVTPQGTTGATTWGYRITAGSSTGETLASAEGTTTAGNATLSATNFNRLTWSAVAGANDYRIYRTTAGGTPATTGLIGTATGLTFDDTGLAASGPVPTVDSSGFVGIGTAAPSYTLDISSGGSRAVNISASAVGARGLYSAATDATATANYGGYFTAAGTGAETSGVYGEVSGAATQISGVYGKATSTAAVTNYGGAFLAGGETGVGVYGEAQSTAVAVNHGGYFVAKGQDGMGVYGEASSTAGGISYGGYFTTAATGSVASGVYGLASGAGNVAGVLGSAHSTGAVTNYGGYFSARGRTARAVYGWADSTAADANFGGWFRTDGTGAGAAGVYGLASGAASVYGVRGEAVSGTSVANYGGYFSSAGIGTGASGVFGKATGGGTVYGVHGEAASGAAVTNYGGYFQSSGAGAGAAGVYGLAFGAASVYGVHGEAVSGTSVANYGGYFLSAGTGAGASGVFGTTAAAGQVFGVRGEATNTGAVRNYGGYFRSNGTGDGAAGVVGYASGASGATRGVDGSVASSTGWGGYFTGGYGLYASRGQIARAPSGNDTSYGLVVQGAVCIDDTVANCPASPASGTLYTEGASVISFDLAELYESTQTLEAGDVVSIDLASAKKVVKSNLAYQETTMGVVSTAPGITLGGWSAGPGKYPVALAGRAPVKVNNENGAIAIGDLLTSSSAPGVAMRATKPGSTIGRALSSWSSPGEGRVEVFISPGWNSAGAIATDGTISFFDNNFTFNKTGAADAATQGRNSRDLVFRGSGWDGATAKDVEMKLKNAVTDATNYKLSIVNNAGVEVAYVGQDGTMGVSNKFYPAAPTGFQTTAYIFYNSNYMRTNTTGWSTGSFDFAEMFLSREFLEPGDIVSVDGETNEYVKKSTGAYDSMVLGIVSTEPGFLAGTNVDFDNPNLDQGYPIALAGRVPTKVSTENGPIVPGDPLTSSSVPGVAMRATDPGMVIGVALEGWNSPGVGKIKVFVNLSWQGVNGSVTSVSELASLNLIGNLNMNGNYILNVAQIVGKDEKWVIDENGVFKVKLVNENAIAKEMFGLTSSKVELTLSGSERLENGQKLIDLTLIDEEFVKNISIETPLKILITPAEEMNGVYIAERNAYSFRVKELNGGTSNAAFDWLVIARRRDYEDPPPEEASVREPMPSPLQSPAPEVLPAEPTPSLPPPQEPVLSESSPPLPAPSEPAPAEPSPEAPPSPPAPSEPAPALSEPAPAPSEPAPIPSEPTPTAQAPPAPSL